MLFNILFPEVYMSFEEKIIIFFTFTIAVIVALVFHEFAHAFTAYKLGDNTAKLQGRLTLNPIVHFDVMGVLCFLIFGFGWAKPVPINTYNFKNIKKDTFLVSFSGILVNFIIAFVFYPLSMLFLGQVVNGTFYYILFCLCYYIYEINLVFMVFNLLPIYPLDGFNMIASQLNYDNKFVNFMYRYGTIILLILIIIFNRTQLFETLVHYVGYPIYWFWNLFF